MKLDARATMDNIGKRIDVTAPSAASTTTISVTDLVNALAG